ncbi:MAG: hypothetical protein WCA30_10105, partial [Dermatophilaceae bacterium]
AWIALMALLVLGSWSLASGSSLRVDGGVLQSWELDADLPAVTPASEPEPDAQSAESDGSQELSEPGVVAEQPTSPPAPAADSQAVAPAAAPEAAEPTTTEMESGTPEGQSAGPEAEPTADPPPPVTAP